MAEGKTQNATGVFFSCIRTNVTSPDSLYCRMFWPGRWRSVLGSSLGNNYGFLESGLFLERYCRVLDQLGSRIVSLAACCFLLFSTTVVSLPSEKQAEVGLMDPGGNVEKSSRMRDNA